MMGVLEGSVRNGNLMRWAAKYDHLPVFGDENLKTDDASHESQRATCKNRSGFTITNSDLKAR